MSDNDEPQVQHRGAQIPELIEDERTQRGGWLSEGRELERLRDKVRTAAEREAAAIVTAARHDVRRVLLDARRELLVLIAQVQAVGCESDHSAEAPILEGESTTATADDTGALATIDSSEIIRDVMVGARKDVHEVLIEARSKLAAMSEEARDLRERLARAQPRLAAAAVQPHVQPPHESSGATFHAETAVASPDTADGALHVRSTAMSDRIDDLTRQYVASSSSNVGIIIGTAAAFIVAALAALWWGLQPSRATPSASSAPAGAASTTAEARPAGANPPGTSASSTGSRQPYLVIEARRASWIRTTIDGTTDRGRVFAAGEKREIVDPKEVAILAGDAGAVLVSFNGGPPTVLGRDGQVASRRFSPRSSAPSPPPIEPPEPGGPAGASSALSSAEGQATTAAPLAGTGSRQQPATTPSTAAAPAPGRAESAAAGAAGEPLSPTTQLEILSADSRWFEAYYKGDHQTMVSLSTPDFSIADERDPSERLPAGATGIQRSLDQVRIEVVGDGAVLSGRLTERLAGPGDTRQQLSLISEVWIRRNGRWLLMGLRFVGGKQIQE
jgi:RodZ C-terminal domain/Domain of unknown function (DUF4440)